MYYQKRVDLAANEFKDVKCLVRLDSFSAFLLNNTCKTHDKNISFIYIIHLLYNFIVNIKFCKFISNLLLN